MDEPITAEKIDELLGFLPLLDVPGREFVEWRVGHRTDTGTLVRPYPAYPEDVLGFFLAAGQPWWSDRGYRPGRAARMLEDENLVRKADLAQIKTMLTYCVRGERSCDGHWAAVLESGQVVALLKRLAVLREDM